MKQNCTFTFIMLLLVMLGLSACSTNDQDNTLNLTFSEYYQDAEDYEKIYPLLDAYFSCIQNAYKNSDKSDLKSFVLPDTYTTISSQLSEISNDTSGLITNGKTNLSKEYIARLQLLEPYLQTEVLLAEKEVLLAGKAILSSSNEEWFTKIEQLLEDTISEYKNGVGQ